MRFQVTNEIEGKCFIPGMHIWRVCCTHMHIGYVSIMHGANGFHSVGDDFVAAYFRL